MGPVVKHTVEQVTALGTEVLAYASTAAVLGDTFLQSLLEYPWAAEPLISGGIFVSTDRPGVLRFADPTLRQSLFKSLKPNDLADKQRAVGLRAVSRLEGFAEPASEPGDSFESLADVVLPAALQWLKSNHDERGSWWREAWSLWLENRGRTAEALVQLEAATVDARGLRSAVLLRRLADLKLTEGQPENALMLAARAPTRGLAISGLPADPALSAVLEQQFTHYAVKIGEPTDANTAAPTRPLLSVLDRWDVMPVEGALLALELLKAEAYSHLMKPDEAERAWSEAGRRLERLTGEAAHMLWLRWATGSSWFFTEVRSNPQEVADRCARVRQRVPATAIAESPLAFDFLRAEELAASSSGNFNRARALIDEQIALTQKTGNLRDRCLAFNARAILHFGQGALGEAATAFATSQELARQTRWVRREAVATHNLALVCTERLELTRARALADHYADISGPIGNHAAKAEAPLVRAGIELARLNPEGAREHIEDAQRHLDENNWPMLQAWLRLVVCRMHRINCLSTRDSLELPRAKNNLMAGLGYFEEHGTAWTEEVDPGEAFGWLATAQALSGHGKVQETLERGSTLVPLQNAVSHRALLVADCVLNKKPADAALGWFTDRGNQRLVKLWQAIAAAL